MSIITQAMVEDRVGADELVRLTDDGQTGAVAADILSQAIADGEAEILSRLNQRYPTLALTNATTRRMVCKACLDVIEYVLYGRRPPRLPDKVKAYDDAIAWANKIAEGKQDLLDESEGEDGPKASGGIVVSAEDRVISRGTMKGL